MGERSGEVMINAQTLTELKGQLSEEEKEGTIGKVLSYIGSLTSAGWSFANAFKNIAKLNKIDQYAKKIESLFDKLKDDKSACKEKALQLLEDHKKNCEESFNNFNYCHDRVWEEVSEGKVTEIEKVKQEVLKAVIDHHKNECNNVITDMVKASGFMATMYLVKLYIAWKQISAASNVINDPNKFDEINKNLSKLSEMVNALVEICSTNQEDKSIDRRMTKITSMYTKTVSTISDLRIKIDGHIQRLDLLGDFAAVDAAMSFATAASQGYQVWNAWKNLTSHTKLLGTVSVALFTFIGMANVRTFLLTQDILEELRKNQKEVNRLKEILDDLHDQADEAVFLR